MANFDNMKAAVESLSGGRCTVIFDDLGMPSIMVQFPKLKYSDLIDGATQDTHPAFIVNGVERECIYISKYINVVVGDRAYSLPQKDPRVYIDFDSSVRACTTKGNGWHLLTNAAWSALALWCRKNNTIPRGNTSFGGSHERPFERGCVTYRYQDGDIMRDGRTATGSGPVFWNHDYSDSGISDLCGNVWEWVSGLRLKDGEIQIVPYGNAMRRECNMSKTSTEWKALTQTGAIVDPGTANTFKYNGTAAGDSTMTNHHVGASVLDIKRDKPNYTGPSTEEYFGYAHNTFESLAAASGVTVPQVMKALGLFPVDSNLSGDGLWVRNYGEHLPLRGGDFGNGAAAGVFALDFLNPRSISYHNVGFRAALSRRQMAGPHGAASRPWEKGIYFRAERQKITLVSGPVVAARRRTPPRGLWWGLFMKSIKHVFDKIVDFDNLYTAYLNARRDKRYRTEILKFSAHLEDHLIAIQNRLLNGDFAPGPYREFYIYEPKKRLIMAQPFEDRVIQWAFYQVLNPVFVKGYITDSYACIPGRGQIAAVKRLQSWLKALPEDDEKKLYVLKLDVSKYFYRASHSVIIQEFNRKVSDKRVQEWLRQQIQNPHVNFGLPPGKSPGDVPKSQRIPGRGMPVGALVSQMLANLNMNPLDQYCKRELSMKYYIRYNDDIIILHYEKVQLHAWKDIIEHYMNERLQLQLNDKTCIRPATLGIDFCGYKIWRDHIKLRKSTALRMKRRLKGIQKDFAEGRITLDRASQTVHSYQGIMKHCNSYRLRRAIFGEYSEDGGMVYEGWFKLQRDSEKIEALKKKNQDSEDGRG